MANVDNPNGFRPYHCPHGGSGAPTVTKLPLLAANAAIGVGDPVNVEDGGVDQADATEELCGIAAESKAASSTDTYIMVWSDPQQLFVAQTDDGTGTATALTALGLNANIVVGTPVNGRSIAEIDEGSADTTATLPLKLMALSTEYIGTAQNAVGEFNRLVVKINNHQFQGHTGTAGI